MGVIKAASIIVYPDQRRFCAENAVAGAKTVLKAAGITLCRAVCIAGDGTCKTSKAKSLFDLLAS